MLRSLRKIKSNLPLSIILITLLAASLRFYNLSWGSGFFFHPDENNMARAIVQFSPENNLHPNFFAYGQFPLYIAYFTAQIASIIYSLPQLPITNYQLPPVPFASAIYYLRFWSALASALTIPLVYLITNMITQKSQSPSTKYQTITKHQGPNSKRFGNWKFENWRLFGIWDLGFGHLAALLTTFTPGLIQAAHFGTTESLLTFFFMLILYISLRLQNITKTPASPAGGQNHKIILLGIISGMALATKLTAIYFIPTPILAILMFSYKKNLPVTCYLLPVTKYLLYTLITFIIFSPYSFLDFNAFTSTISYESAVALGKTQVFYTRQFLETTPLHFQFTKIFPYTLGLPFLLIGTLGFGSILFSTFKPKSPQLQITNYKLLLIAFLAYLLPNSLIFTKWTRFMTPILPFFSIFAAYLLSILTNKKTASFETVLADAVFDTRSPDNRSILTQSGKPVNTGGESGSRTLSRRTSGRIVYQASSATAPNDSPPSPIIFIFLVALSIIPGIIFFKIYTKPDTRLAASQWIYQNIPADSYILSEAGNVVDIPVPCQDLSLCHFVTLSTVINFDFYNLDSSLKLQNELVNHLTKANYIIVPSRRVFMNHLRFPERYPLSSAYYSALFSGKLGFELVHKAYSPQLPIANYQLPLLEEKAEETWTVFDHPVVRVYKKNKQYNKTYYQKILE